MSSFELNIPDISFTKNFTIIYKGKKQGEANNELVEIETSKEELIRRLRYFNDRSPEIRYQTEIFIHDKFPVKIFQDFILSLETRKIQIDTNNYSDFYELSRKYEYKELQNEVEMFIKTRPDLCKITEQLSNESNDETENDSKLKEEIIAQNLDLCLQNGHLNRLSISVLNRIFNSPKRVLKNHHLLFKFIKEKLNSKNNCDDIDELQMLTSSLDFNEMSFQEIESLINDENYSDVFKPKNSKLMMKTFLKERDEYFNAFNDKLSKIQEQFSQFQAESSSNNQNNQKKIQELEILTKKQEQIIKNQNKQIENLSKFVEQEKNERIKNEKEIKNQSKQIESLSKCVEQEKNERIKNEEEIKKQISQLEIKNQELKSINENMMKQKENELMKMKEMNNENLKTIQKLKNENEKEKSKKIKLETQIKEESIINIQFSGKPFSGIFDKLTKQANGNINEKGIIGISGNIGVFTSFSILVDYKCIGRSYYSKEDQNSYICFDFKSHQISVSAYSIKSPNSENPDFLQSWVLEGSNDKNNWTQLDSHSNDKSLSSDSKIVVFHIQNKSKSGQSFKYIQLRITGKSSRGKYYLEISNIEFFGEYF